MNTTDFQTRTTATPHEVWRNGYPVSRRTASFGTSLPGLERPRMRQVAMSDCHRAPALQARRTGDMPLPTGRANEFPRRTAPPEWSATGGS